MNHNLKTYLDWQELRVIVVKLTTRIVKELLLKCVDQTILLFGQVIRTKIEIDETSSKLTKFKEATDNQDTLRSGWKSILDVIGIATQDIYDQIAKLGFNMLTVYLRIFICG